MKKILVTSALPYANGAIHLGHMVEYIQTDVWVRFQKMSGNLCYYVCADDAHGTAIMLKAKEQGITPEKLINQVKKEHERDFSRFGINFDHYHSTHSDENKELSESIYNRLNQAGYITQKSIAQAYDPKAEIFLPDRYIKGECPKCGALDQYGDNCEACGATYTSTELKNPRSTLSNATPVTKQTEHYFFDLAQFTAFLKEWTRSGTLNESVSNKMDEWLQTGLQSWDITRDSPYFGFTIPGNTDKYFYVWLDAPIGYMASFKYFCQQKQIDFDEWFIPESTCELHHFIGKDITNFHCLFWPAMLEGSGYRKPTRIHVHGFLTINGEKMSKSRGTFITAEHYLEHFEADSLRYYMAAKLNGKVEDIDLDLQDFLHKHNSDLVGKIANIPSRLFPFIHRFFDGRLAEPCDATLIATFKENHDSIIANYEACNTASAVRTIMKMADIVNQFISDEQPWKLAKDASQKERLHQCASMGIHLFYFLVGWLKPIIPEFVKQSEMLLNVSIDVFPQFDKTLKEGHKINEFTPLIQRLDKKNIEKLMPDPVKTVKNNNEMSTEGIDVNNHMISLDTLNKVDLRLAKIIEAEAVPDAHKLLKLRLDLGKLGTRQVFSGIKAHYSPDDLIGRYTAYVSNLKPRKMRFGVSEGMILTVDGGDRLWLLSPQEQDIQAAGLPIR